MEIISAQRTKNINETRQTSTIEYKKGTDHTDIGG